MEPEPPPSPPHAPPPPYHAISPSAAYGGFLGGTVLSLLGWTLCCTVKHRRLRNQLLDSLAGDGIDFDRIASDAEHSRSERLSHGERDANAEELESERKLEEELESRG